MILSDNIINFESVCAEDEFDVKIWNMNIPWSETLAGIDSFLYKDIIFLSISYFINSFDITKWKLPFPQHGSKIFKFFINI